MKIRTLVDTVVFSACLMLVAGPAPAPVLLPEPGTISIFALGIGALYLISRHKRRK